MNTFIKPYDPHGIDQQAQQLCRSLSVRLPNLTAQLKKICRCFLNQPYVLGALGEGPSGEFDQNPLYRFDGFDCVTFVNTVLALLFSQNFHQFKQKIIELNYYQQCVRYENRFHFTELDWNQACAQQGYLTNCTPAIQLAEAWIDRPNWLKRRTLQDLKYLQAQSADYLQECLNQLHTRATCCQAQWNILEYVPLTELFNAKGAINKTLLAQFPDGGVLEIVRPNWNLRAMIGTNLNISHLGFIFREKDRWHFAHASLLEKKVVEVDLVSYLKSLLTSPTIKGVHLLKINEEKYSCV